MAKHPVLQKLEADTARRAKRQKWGCLTVIGVPIIGFVGLMWWGVSIGRE